MTNPEDSVWHEGNAPEGRPRRPPPTIDVKAVEVSLDRPGAAAANPDTGSDTKQSPKGIWASLLSRRAAMVGSVCVVAAIAAGAFWIHVMLDGADRVPDGAVLETAKPDDAVERAAKLGADLKAAPEQGSQEAALANRVTGLEAKLARFADRIAALERDVRDNNAAAGRAGERADMALGLLAELKKNGAEQNALQGRERALLDDVAARLKSLEDLEAERSQKQEALDHAAATAAATPDRALRSAIVAAALRSAVERNDPFTTELAVAREAGVDEKALNTLQPFAATGVPRRSELLHDLSALLPELSRVSVPAGHDASYLDRLRASAIKMMNIRPVRDEPGDDPMTVIGRIEFKAGSQDIAGVVSELDGLPAPARELARPWRARALAWQGAVESARLITNAAFAKLGEPMAREPSPR
jgi:hypothetical protein